MKPIVSMTLWVLLSATLSGCSFDLFHDTSWLTACDIDPTTEGCSPEDKDGGRDGSDDDGATGSDAAEHDAAEHDAAE